MENTSKRITACASWNYHSNSDFEIKKKDITVQFIVQTLTMYIMVQFYKSLSNLNFMLEFDALPPTYTHTMCVGGIHMRYNVHCTLHFLCIKNFCIYILQVCIVGPVTVYWDSKHDVTMLKP